MTGDEAARRRARPRFSPRLLVLLLILPIAFLITRTRDHTSEISQAQAVAIARAQVTYRIDGENIRFLRQGIPSRGYWAVSLWQRTATGGRTNVTLVVLDAVTGKISRIDRDVAP